ncbi:MAG: sulfite exporter TauE/SafE family protein [Pigmentiphaga sp.]|uniref:sulfite exporter TauE/SafE family protein n=1 Tax=Pigmentiphaga sp. TaxID=1977564 RepID=UPI0029B693D0|nr:sulfite exporter TauE/SafE family protein [Pigmentiphaga sp.]MDX3906873.1 sulfite exporter TauE/SafE family protein [Pigmentiphaga sp.]
MDTFSQVYSALGGSLILLVLGTFFVAGAVKGVIGLGLPTVAMGLLGLAMAPPQAAALLVVPSMVTNVWQLAAGGRFLALMRRLWPLLAAIVAGTWATAALAGTGSQPWAVRALGVALVLYAVSGLFAFTLHVPPPRERLLGALAGAATGAVTAVTGVFVIPAVPYLQALGLAKDELVQALGMAFTVSTLALAAALARDGALGHREMAASLVALVPAMAGMWAGQYWRHRISPAAFRRGFFSGLGLLGLYLCL